LGDFYYLKGRGKMNIVTILSIIIFFAITIIPLVLVVRETLKDISRVEMPQKKNKGAGGAQKKKDGNLKGG
jgi:preprotein translocase subunit SecY